MTEDRKKILEKLQKLRELANDPTGNVNETASAAARMTRLMLEHNIAEAELEIDEYAGDIYFRNGDRREKWQLFLISSLAQANSCTLAEFKRGEQIMVTVVGVELDVATVRYLYDLCCKQLKTHLRIWKMTHYFTSEEEFMFGAVSTIKDRVTEERAKVIEENLGTLTSQALVHLDTRGHDAFLHFNGGKESSTKKEVHLTPRDARAFHAGVRAGQSIQLAATGAALEEGKRRLSC